MTTLENVTDWRQLSDHLTAYQQTEMRLFEDEMAKWQPSPEVLVRIARGMVESNLAQIRLAHIPVPADCIDTPGPWEEWGDGIYQRVYTCWQRQAEGVEVSVLGYQRSDGSTRRSVFVSNTDDEVVGEQARAIGGMLLAAADEADRLNGDAPPFM